MSEDMSDILNKFSSMLQNNEIPEELKNVMNNFSSDKQDVSSNKEEKSSPTFDFDINTMLKMKSIMDTINTQKDDPRADLLRSLKPYLKNSRKEKVDQYIKIFSMEKIFENLGPLGGGKKDDV